jgi:hypothetical protein
MERSVAGGTRYGTMTVQHLNACTEAALTSYVSVIWLSVTGGVDSGRTYSGYVQQRYVTSSGEIHWVFFLREKDSGAIVAAWQSPDHPCMGNGGKPLLLPHPFVGYDEDKYEVVSVNPSKEEIAAIAKAGISDEDRPDRDILQVILQDYEIDEKSEPVWPTKAVTVGLPREVEVDGEMVPVQDAPRGTLITPIKRVIPKPKGILLKSLIKKKDLSYFEPYRMAS